MADGRRTVLEVPEGGLGAVAKLLRPSRDDTRTVASGWVSNDPSIFGGATSAQELALHSERARAWVAQRRQCYEQALDDLIDGLELTQAELEEVQAEVSARMASLNRTAEQAR